MEALLEQDARPRMVDAVLNYCGDMDYKPMSVARTSHGHPKSPGKGGSAAADEGETSVDPNANAMSSLNIEPRHVQIEDGSSVSTHTDLDREGFILMHHPSKVTDFKDMDQIQGIYYPEIRALMKDLVGAEGVEFPPEAGAYRSTKARANESRAAMVVHLDFTDKGANYCMSQELPDRPKNIRRWAFYKIWRALSPVAPVDVPFAVMDSQSLKRTDIVPVDTQYEHIPGVTESAVLHYNPDHRWMYFSQMKRDDIVVFKTYDSDSSKNFPVAHTAFTDTSAPDLASRSSFELRTYVCWYE